eukprot:CAMPEP_0114578946 /NCGR_PEP_ID=MMETSP0125-20121206/3415_1 /TAXON_ID=485358 ORGANISM="Aristerostoma sp., Strain ATCC 50986" /NCGR_SAMPLE_ID=MMETSP0125 /ASSEMBLY_ACC=CAM_ASM_000245 /LENGTH=116 /DNA_ID=CAMNT_0001769383 /DNA_START=675 /DNA_END=1022 /DNA_ORIENTATION=-
MTEFDLDAWLALDRIKAIKDHLIIVRDPDVPFEISSTIIREKIKAGESIEQFVPKKVADWHAEKGIKYPEKPIKSEEEKKKEEEEVLGPLENFIDFKCDEIKFEELEHDYKDNVPW